MCFLKALLSPLRHAKVPLTTCQQLVGKLPVMLSLASWWQVALHRALAGLESPFRLAS